MCGRFTLTTPGEVLAEVFGLDAAPQIAPRYNIAPTQDVLVVRQPRGAPRGAALLKWGLVRRSAREPERPLINARAESALDLPSFREAFERWRCLVPADGFFEWGPRRGTRGAFHIRMQDHRPFGLAGLWQPAPDGAEGGSCVVLTTQANELVARIHDRMPVILDPADYARWLDPAVAEPRALIPLLRPHAAEDMTSLAVGPAVNSARTEGPQCLDPARDEPVIPGLFE